MSPRISTDQESGWGKLGNFAAASSLSQVQKKDKEGDINIMLVIQS